MKRALLLPFLFCAHAGADGARINASGQIEAPARDVRVFGAKAQTPLFGTVSVEAGTARFSPALPFVAGESYRVELQREDGTWRAERLIFERPHAAAPTVSLAPSPAVLPANALKLYLHFTQPMEQGVLLERLTLRRQDESIVHGAFRETELWSPDGRRLTLWLHPGRQKTGVNLNRDEGPVLIAGEKHLLKISGAWRSAAGVPLGNDVSFVITAAAADHACPDPARWRLDAPQAHTRAALVLRFDEPLDPAMLVSSLSLPGGTGVVEVSSDGRTWSWTPSRPWVRGTHAVAIDPLLEDLAGNNLQHPFEVDRSQMTRNRPQTTLKFDVR